MRIVRTILIACGLTLASAPASASPIVVLNDGFHKDTIISRGNHRIQLFASEATIDPWPTPGGDAAYSLRINFQYLFGDPDVVSGSIQGNDLPLFPPRPIESPALAVFGGLKLEGTILDEGTVYLQPAYDPDGGSIVPAALHHDTHPFADFNLESFADGDMAYIGYATSDLSVFGYMQIQRVNVLDWKLIGYAYDPSGAGILVTNLVPAPGVLGLAAASLLGLPRRRTSK